MKHDSKYEAMMANNQSLMEHYFMIIILKRNLQACGSSNQLEELGTRIYRDVHEIEAKTEDMEQNSKYVVAFIEVAGQKQDEGLIDKFKER